MFSGQRNVVTTQAYIVMDVAAGDFNNDGFIDLASVGGDSVELTSVQWYNNTDGKGTFGKKNTNDGD